MRSTAPTEHIRINVNKDDFPDEAKARELAEEAGKSTGRLPYILRWNIFKIAIHGGFHAWGGGSSEILIHTGFSDGLKDHWEAYDETMVHEASHVSLDPTFRS